MRSSVKYLILLSSIAFGLSACRTPPARVVPVPTGVPHAAATQPTTRQYVALNEKSLPHAHWVNEKILSGAQPEGDEGFQVLQKLGIKTIISVDGATPDVDSAHRFGMKYVHLPFGYDGVPAAQGQAIAKALRDLPGPIYIHCHHGKHRSAAGVAVACVYNGMLPPSEAENVLKTWGTGANYKGLWADARNARPLPAGELDSLHVTYVEKAKIPAMAASMVQADYHMDNLKDMSKSAWQPIAAHPGLDASNEALLLEETFTEIGRTNDATSHTEDFQKQLANAAKQARALSEMLRSPMHNPADADKAVKQLNQSCLSCHAQYRD